MQKKLTFMAMKAQTCVYKAKAEWRRMCEEEEGLDVIIAVVMLSIGLIVAGVLAKYATQIINATGKQVNQVTGNTVGNFSSGAGTGGGFSGGGSGGGGGGSFGGGGGGGGFR